MRVGASRRARVVEHLLRYRIDGHVCFPFESSVTWMWCGGHRSRERESPVDDQVGASDEARLIAEQKGCGRGNFVWPCPPAGDRSGRQLSRQHGSVAVLD